MWWGVCRKGPDYHYFPLEEEWEDPLEKISFSPNMGVKFQENLVIGELITEEFLHIYRGFHRFLSVLDTDLFI